MGEGKKQIDKDNRRKRINNKEIKCKIRRSKLIKLRNAIEISICEDGTLKKRCKIQIA